MWPRPSGGFSASLRCSFCVHKGKKYIRVQGRAAPPFPFFFSMPSFVVLQKSGRLLSFRHCRTFVPISFSCRAHAPPLSASNTERQHRKEKDKKTQQHQTDSPPVRAPPLPWYHRVSHVKKKKQGANRAPATKHHPPQKAKGNKTKHTRKRHTPNTLPAGAAHFFGPPLYPFVSVSFFPVSMFVWALVSPEP